MRFHLADRKQQPRAGGQALEGLGWRCPAAEALCLEGAAAGVCRYWARRTCDVAERHVRAAFQVDLAPRRSVPLFLALAGCDAEDHEATMGLVEVVLRERLPQAQTALVAPEELRSLYYANRQILRKLRREPKEVEEVEEVEEEADEEPCFNFSSPKEGVPTVLIFQGVDAAPKDVLRQVLSFWHASCMEIGVPLLIFFGPSP